jgi:tRNA 2-selenouridine synthase
VKEYATFDHQLISEATERIKKRLGGQNVKLALEALEKNDYQTVASILLIYYDKAYLKGLDHRDQSQVHRIRTDKDDPDANAELVLGFYKSTFGSLK